MDQQPIQTQSAPPADPGAHYQMPATNPGQTTGIIGLIFAFIGLAPIGLILSIVSTVQNNIQNLPQDQIEKLKGLLSAPFFSENDLSPFK